MKDHGKSTDQRFGLVMGIAFLTLSLYFMLVKDRFLPVPAGLSFLFFCAAVFMPGILAPINRAWTKLSFILGTINTWILLTLLYFLIIVPMGFALKMLGKDPLKLKMTGNTGTYWEKTTAPEGSSMKQQF